MRDVNFRELVVVVPLLALSLFLGLYPKPVIDRVQPSVELRVSNLERKSDYRRPKPPKIVQQIQNSLDKASSDSTPSTSNQGQSK